jgi:hypothetical protein
MGSPGSPTWRFRECTCSLRPRGVPERLALTPFAMLPSVSTTTSAPRSTRFSRLNSWPARTPANAWLRPSRAASPSLGATVESLPPSAWALSSPSPCGFIPALSVELFHLLLHAGFVPAHRNFGLNLKELSCCPDTRLGCHPAAHPAVFDHRLLDTAPSFQGDIARPRHQGAGCGLPDEPPDAWPACPVVWEGAGRPRPLPDRLSQAELV